ncbi:MAG: LLM class flavin-dependent oxidoreductase [SAR202 cluster bacterium]|jgi:alkanesulfonate monooxygenase SsuD/methylene tetrahydromethanopterin reductase-like flavin-dependent oxidoreductase (luciferase family)|nr:LLM class flavin-dependent oxidoreductase [SAR202 cluster bacterium]|tara:strand:+ start:4854 stop:5930 length:1077 start_codon:yes stop_codon:yes gene_type:complete
MNYGLFYLFSDFGNIEQSRIYTEVLDEIEYAESLGFDSVWLPEHHFSNYAMMGNPLTFAAAVSQRTQAMRIGTAVVLLPFQHPLRVAEDAALVDSISGGRLMLGVGRGYQPPEFQGFGIAQELSSCMFRESLEILLKALSGENFSYQGNYWQIEAPTEIFPKPIQKPHPPLYIASVTARSIEVAADFGMSLIRAPQFSTLDAVEESYELYREKMTIKGHDVDQIDQPLSIRTYVAPTDEEAWSEAQHAVWFYKLMATLLPGAPGRPAPVSGYENYPQNPEVLAKTTLTDLKERGTAFGSPENVAKILNIYIERLRPTHLMLQMRIGGLEHWKVKRSMKLFAEEVVPRLTKEIAAGPVI